MHQEHLKDEIVAMLTEILETPVDDSHVDLSSLGMNSMKAIQLIVELETRYDIEFEDSELLLKNFNTINSILTKVEEKRSNLAV
ncbi:acyl carrier protein [Paenibacillus xylaniclasticus]|uniref:acyl carrier protein n=1 Tax=Paenibacillus xylaniclasticus TaxID=588083 RepID=UPI000FDA48F2|nr:MULTISPECIES: acyl carrier protein [Paenibacillus]GFN32200.1 hypothetical protein PCURB6_24600 [Paenibacillus curdlanolyticus]